MLYVWNFVQSQRISYAIYMKTGATEQILLSQLIQSQKDKYDLFSLIFYFLDFTKMNKNMYGCRV